MGKLPRSFYRRRTLEVAIGLLGCQIVSRTDGIKTGGMIIETEAYIGESDPACHAFAGRTRRNEVMYGGAGFLYVYFTYGNHYMLNVVTEKSGFPAAVLLRAVEPLFNVDVMAKRRKTAEFTNISSGPGKLAKALAIERTQNGTDLCGTEIYISGPANKRAKILSSIRIGIGEKGNDKLWRFFVADNQHVSSPNRNVRETIVDLKSAQRINFSL